MPRFVLVGTWRGAASRTMAQVFSNFTCRNYVMALVVLTLLPPLVLVLMFQRWFFASLSETGHEL